ncbi:MAG: M24 family metallopeptidase [Thaumarchaeota archaeon]|nr:M24 family metallopeptidase [Nitrososphaerota archaeon]
MRIWRQEDDRLRPTAQEGPRAGEREAGGRNDRGQPVLPDRFLGRGSDSDEGLRGKRGFEAKPDLFLRARRVKDDVELERILKASKGLDKVFQALPGVLSPGRTEWEVAAEVMKIATLNGLTPSGSDSALSPTIVASGPNGALPHSELTARKIRRGDFVVADMFFRFHGYNSDETRTFAVGQATKEMRDRYSIVLEAQEEALGLIRGGTPCRDVHNRAVSVLRRHKVEKYLNHSVGHGVGIDIHELPSISKLSKDRLLVDDVVTDEPGIYFPGKYGIRIEDTVKTERKPVVLTNYTKELVICG